MLGRIQVMSLLAAAVTVAGSGCKKGSQATNDVGMASTGSGEVRITDVQLGRRVGPDRRVTNEMDNFSSRDTIYASVLTSGTAPSTTVTARWTYQDGQLVSEDSRTISPSGAEATEFHIAKPSAWPKGKYKVTVTAGGSTESEDFEVK